MCKIRKLKASEIDCRVSTISAKGCSLLLYKDARVDQNILDETFGIFGWQRKHELIGDSLYCTVSVKNPETGEWVSKQDVGTKSYTEEEKGLSSDSFKRACFNFGIGRELYTAPFIWIGAEDVNISDKNGKPTTYDRFYVSDIGYDEAGNINYLVIFKEKPNVKVYQFGGNKPAEKPVEKPAEKPTNVIDINAPINKMQAGALMNRIGGDQRVLEHILSSYKVNSLNDLSIKAFQQLNSHWDKLLAKAHENESKAQ